MSKKHISEKRAVKRARALKFIFFIAVIAFLFFTYTCVLVPRRTYNAAETAFAEEDYAAASGLYDSLGDYEDSVEKMNFCDCYTAFDFVKQETEKPEFLSDEARKKLEAGHEAYLKLNAENREKIIARFGTFFTNAEKAVEKGDYATAFSYYAFDRGNPESDSRAHALEAYLTAQKHYESGSYAEARATISAIAQSDLPSISIEHFVSDCYAAEYAIYDAFAETDTQYAIDMMATISEYGKAASFIKDTEYAYSSAFDEMDKGNYDNAIGLFTSLNNYKDSADMIFTCEVLAVNAEAVKGETEQAVSEIMAMGEEALAILPVDSPLWDAMSNWSVGGTVYYGMYEGKHVKWCVTGNKNGVYTIVLSEPLMSVPFDAGNPGARWNNAELSTLVKGNLSENYKSSNNKKLSAQYLRLPYANEINLILSVNPALSGADFWLTDSGIPTLYSAGKTTHSVSAAEIHGLILIAEVKNA